MCQEGNLIDRIDIWGTFGIFTEEVELYKGHFSYDIEDNLERKNTSKGSGEIVQRG